MGFGNDIYHQKSCHVHSYVKVVVTSYGSRAKGISAVGGLHHNFFYVIKDFSYQHHVQPGIRSKFRYYIMFFVRDIQTMVYFCVVGSSY